MTMCKSGGEPVGCWNLERRDPNHVGIATTEIAVLLRTPPIFTCGRKLAEPNTMGLESSLREQIGSTYIALIFATEIPSYNPNLRSQISEYITNIPPHQSQLLGHCQAVTDIPANQFGPELIAAYPTAKIILTTRPIDAWHASVLGSIESQRRSWAIGFFNLFHADGWLASKAWDVWSRAWEGDFEKNGKMIFVEHNENVRRLAAGNLLEFRVEQGW